MSTVYLCHFRYSDAYASDTSDALAWQQPPRTGCYVCWFHGGELDNGHIVCARPDGRTMGYVARGCAYWQREPGAGDE